MNHQILLPLNDVLKKFKRFIRNQKCKTIFDKLLSFLTFNEFYKLYGIYIFLNVLIKCNFNNINTKIEIFL